MERQKEQGSALILTMVVTIILLFLGSSLGLLSMVESRMSLREEQNMQAYYLARSGADALAQYIIDNPTLLDEAGGIINKVSETQRFGPGEFTVQVLKDADGVWVESRGVVDETVRTVRLVLIESLSLPSITNAIFSSGTGKSGEAAVRLDEGVAVSGTVATSATHDGAVQIPNGTIYGDLLIGRGAKSDNVLELGEDGEISGTVTNLSQEIHYPVPSFPSFPTLAWKGSYDTSEWNKELDYRIEEDGHYDKIEVVSNRTLKIYVGDGTRRIRVRKITGYGNIELVGTGELVLYVEEEFSLDSDQENKDNPHPGINMQNGNRDPRSLTLYYNGDDTFGAKRFNLCGNVVVDHAPVLIQSDSKLHGNLFVKDSKEVVIRGDCRAYSSVLYAPKATVKFAGSGSWTGGVVSSQLFITGGRGPRIVFSDVMPESFPDGIFGEGSTGGGSLARGLWSEL